VAHAIPDESIFLTKLEPCRKLPTITTSYRCGPPPEDIPRLVSSLLEGVVSSADLIPSHPRNSKNSLGSGLLSFFAWALGFILLGILLVSLTNAAVVWSSSDRFCGQFCHSMIWANTAYQKSPHYHNQSGVRASCGDCHIPYDSSHANASEYFYLLLFKADRGAKDFWNEALRRMATKEEWEKRRPQLIASYESYLVKHNYITCRGCHSLEAFGGPRSHMKELIHKNMVKPDALNCLHCHSDLGHVYEESPSVTPAAERVFPSSGTSSGRQVEPEAGPPAQGHYVTPAGWYTAEQASNGAKLYASYCVSCHGTKLEGGAGPALNGISWNQRFAGTKLLTIWGEIHGPMAQYAGTTFAEQQSLDILAFLLQQNGLPAGTYPLADTRQLSRTLPLK
jgi:cytochrome c-type protein NapC